MTPERLAEIREYTLMCTVRQPHINTANHHRAELLAYVDQLIGERDRARDLAIRAGAFD